jgi:hypothetical protein
MKKLKLAVVKNLTANTSVVPKNAREEVRSLFKLPPAQPISDLIQTPEFLSLKNDFLKEKEEKPLSDIDFSSFISHAPMFDLRTAWIDYVDQRERLKDDIYKKNIIKIALEFSTKTGEFPALKVPKDSPEDKRHGYLLDWQKRCLALMLREVYEYPASQVFTTTEEFSKDFNGQFKFKDMVRNYDKFKARLAEEDPKAWAMQNCFDRLNLTIYPFSASGGDGIPLLSALGDVEKTMYHSQLNPNEKSDDLKDRKFSNFVRAIGIYRRVWPQSSKTEIQGSWIRGMSAVIASFDHNILNGTDDWVVEILVEAKDPKYDLHTDMQGNSVGLVAPDDWTSKKNWQGNRFHQNAIVSFAKAWNIIRNSKGHRHIPKLDENPIKGLEGDAKMLSMQKA